MHGNIPRRRCNQFNTPWTHAAKARLIELWTTTDMSTVKMASLMGAEFNVHWFPSSISRKAEILGLPRRKPVLTWTPEMLGRLKSLWEKNDKSATEVAAQLNGEYGTNFTRNSILGKIYNLKLTGRRVLNKTTPEQRRERENLRKRLSYAKNRDKILERNKKYAERVRARLIAPSIEDYAIPTPQRKTLMQLGAHDCRWPVGEPQSPSFFFCGAVAEIDRPYCSAHCARAYRETNMY